MDKICGDTREAAHEAARKAREHMQQLRRTKAAPQDPPQHSNSSSNSTASHLAPPPRHTTRYPSPDPQSERDGPPVDYGSQPLKIPKPHGRRPEGYRGGWELRKEPEEQAAYRGPRFKEEREVIAPRRGGADTTREPRETEREAEARGYRATREARRQDRGEGSALRRAGTW